MSYVGTGCGDYIQETTYKYIGCGAGEFEVIAAKKANYTCLFIGGGVGLLVLVIVLVLLLLPGPPTTTTTSLTTAAPFNCLTLDNPDMWTIAKKSYCCDKVGKGCTTTTPPPTYNGNTREVWTAAKKDWCCANTNQPPGTCGGLPPTTQAPYNCNTREAWTAAKKDWCCANTNQPPGTCGGLPPPPPSTCQIWGDPHIDTFDKGHADFYGEGIKWIVKSVDVSIQGRYKATPFTNGLAATNAVAIGGTFMQGHVLKVGPMENGQITFDNQVILTSFGTYSMAGLGTVTYDDKGELVDGAMGHLERHIVHIALPEGVTVEVMRWSNHINLRITMTPRPGQDGHCGNFNQNPADDSTDGIRARIGMSVPQSESLFRVYMPAVPGKHKTIADCEPTQKEMAQRACGKAGRTDMEACIFDACFAGPQYVNEGM